MFKTPPTDCSKLTLPDLDLIASQTQLVQRQSRRFSPDGFLQTLLKSVVTGLASLNQIVDDLGKRVAAPMSAQSMHERFSTKSTAFLLGILRDLTKQRYQPVRRELNDSPVKRLFIEDASAQVMPKSNAAHFPAHGNHHGETAGVKVDFAYDLLTGEVITHTLERATTQDKLIGREALAEVKPGDLVLRDMGYFIIDEFSVIESMGASWLTRLPLTTDVTVENGKPLEKLLKTSRDSVVDLGVLVGKQKKKCRLVAVRADQATARTRRRERRKTARHLDKVPCQKALTRDGWHLMLTNLEKEDFSATQLTGIYRARWAIEIQFRAWKQSLNLSKALRRKSNGHHIQALVLAAMIAHQLGMRVARLIGDQVGRARLSYERLYDTLASHLAGAMSFMDLVKFNPDSRHITRNKRAAVSPIESALRSLT
jgi:hypothetical protein